MKESEVNLQDEKNDQYRKDEGTGINNYISKIGDESCGGRR